MTGLFWDGVLRGGAGALFALLMLLFAQNWRASLTARLGVLLTVAGLCYLLLPAAPVSEAWWPLLVIAMSTAAPGLFWLFAESWFDDEFRLRVWRLAAVGLGILSGLAAHTIIEFETGAGEPIVLTLTGAAEEFTRIAFRLSSLLFVLLGIVAALRGRRADLVEARRRARLALAVTTGLLIFSVLLTVLPLREWPPPMGWRLLNAGGLFAVAGVFALATLGWRDPTLLAPPGKMPVQALPSPGRDDSALLARLASEMKRERLYRESGLTITAVAARLGAPEYRLRQAINQGLGARNFNAFLNSFRLEEVRAALADPSQRTVPILTIALDAGFGSLAPFNRAFREAEGCSPSQFRARALVGSSSNDQAPAPTA